MPSIRDKSTQEQLAKAFTSNKRNKEKAMLAIGYSKQYARHRQATVWASVGLNKEIAKIDAETGIKLGWNRDTNLQHQYKQIGRYEAILTDQPNNMQALQGLNQVLRELNASSGQHTSTVLDGKASKDIDLSPEQIEELKQQAKALTKPKGIPFKSHSKPVDELTQDKGKEIA